MAAAIVVVALLLGGTGATDVLTDNVRRTDSEDLSQLTGRVDIWSWSIDASSDRPLLGHGLATGNAALVRERTVGSIGATSGSSHNLILEIWREVGLVGVAFAAGATAVASRRRQLAAFLVLAYLAASGMTMPTTGLAGVILATWIVVIAWPMNLKDAAQASLPSDP